MKKEELEQFILKYGETLMKFCKITTNDSELAWELYQDTMLRLVEHYKKLDMSENVKAWAISTAINLWKNKKRKYAWRKRIAKQESYEVHMENEFQIFDYANFSGEQDNSPEDTAIKNELEIKPFCGNLSKRWSNEFMQFQSSACCCSLGCILYNPVRADV